MLPDGRSPEAARRKSSRLSSNRRDRSSCGRGNHGPGKGIELPGPILDEIRSLFDAQVAVISVMKSAGASVSMKPVR